MSTSDMKTLAPEEVSPHPKNEAIYGDEPLPEDFIESIRENGIREPLVVTPDHIIISGHRRWRAAKQIGLETIPVRVKSYDADYEEWAALLDYNKQRVKTDAQLVREYRLAKRIEEERAKDRQGTRSDIRDAVPESSGRSRDKAAEAIGSSKSGKTLERGAKVKEKADEGDEKAKEEWEKIEGGETTITEAYHEVTGTDTGEDDVPNLAEDASEEYGCDVCGDPVEDLSYLGEHEGETIEIERICIVNWPHDFTIHTEL